MIFTPLQMIIIAIGFIFLDKILTLENINTVAKNKPLVQAVTIEKNPLAKWLFINYGLGTGTLLMSIVSCVQFLLSWILIRFLLDSFSEIPGQIAFYILITIYFVTILNNLFFLIKFKLNNKKLNKK